MTEIEEAMQVHGQTHELIETLAGAGLPERVIVTAMHQALVERLLSSGGVQGAQAWMRMQTDSLDDWGERFISTARGN